MVNEDCFCQICEIKEDCPLATLTAENERFRQIIINCHDGWPDEVLQQALWGGEERKP